MICFDLQEMESRFQNGEVNKANQRINSVRRDYNVARRYFDVSYVAGYGHRRSDRSLGHRADGRADARQRDGGGESESPRVRCGQIWRMPN